MKLIELHTREYGPLDAAVVPMDGLVTFFGANSAGKTYVLEQVLDVLTDRPSRSDPARDEIVQNASLLFELDQADVPGHIEERIHHSFLTSKHRFLVDDDYEDHEKLMLPNTRGMTTEEAQSAIAEELACWTDCGSIEQRELLARYCMRSRTFIFDMVELKVAVRPPTDRATLEAAQSIAEASVGYDPLGEIARDITSGRFGVVQPTWWALERAQLFAGLVDAILLDCEPKELNRDLTSALARIHNRVFSILISSPERGSVDANDRESLPSTFLRDLMATPPDLDPHFEVRAGYRDFEVILHDPTVGSPRDQPSETWLEWFPESSEPSLARSALRVRPSILGVARMIGARATELLPSFVRGRIELRVLDPLEWRDREPRLRTVLVKDGIPEDVGVLGSGVARWIAAATRLAGEELSRSRVTFREPTSGSPVDDLIRAREIARAALGHAERLAGVSIRRSTRPLVLAVDEPEAHLHPAAIRSIADWLGQRAAEGTVLLATHQPQLLNILSRRGRVVLVRRGGGGVATIEDVSHSLQEGLRSISPEIGLSAADLLLLTRLVLFVEGPVDEAVLLGMFPGQFEHAGVTVIPFFGTQNARALVDSQIVSRLGIPMAILLDNTSVSHVTHGKASTPEEFALWELLKEAEGLRTPITPFGHSKRDILNHLDEVVCRQFAPSFPGWSAAAAEWRAGGLREGIGFKTWLRDQYDFRSDRIASFRMAMACAEQGVPSKSLADRVRDIVNLAGSFSPPEDLDLL